MKFHDQLQIETQQTRQYLLDSPIIQQVLERNFSMETYIVFLNQAYHHVQHTIPILMRAGAKLGSRRPAIQRALATYISEEIGHEQWILNDIAACGYDREQFESSHPPVSSEIMVAYIYDYIERINPMGVFGMVQVLEATSANLASMVAKLVQQKLFLPEAATTYLSTHGELDQEHILFFENVMNTVSNKEDQQAVIHAANVIYKLYGDVYRSLPDASFELNKQNAA